MSFQIEAIFELGDVDGDGEIDMGEFVGMLLDNMVAYIFVVYKTVICI